MDEVTYEENEKVLVHHQNRIYEAKIIKVEFPKINKDSKKKPLYFIHYLGWKEKWNEWVESNSILKLTEKNKELQKKVNNKASSTTGNAAKKSRQVVNSKQSSSSSSSSNNSNSNNQDDDEDDQDGGNSEELDDSENVSDDGNGENGSPNDNNNNINNNGNGNSENDNDDHSPRSTTSSTSSRTSSTTSSTSKNKRKRNESKYSQQPTNKYIEIDIPITLKGKLVDDWNYVNNEKSIVQLPKDPSIQDILDTIVDESDNKSQEYKEIINGIKQYFNKALGTLLLYKFERHQYDQILKTHPNKSMSEIYGAEHLLRLFVKLPQLLVISNLEEKTISQLNEVFTQVLQYLDKNSATLFTKDYNVASNQYQKAASN